MSPEILRSFDLNLLVTLDALLTTGNVSHAASSLRLSQSTVSGHLAKLREVFGDELLMRRASGRGMVLTPNAELLREQVRASLTHVQAMLGNRASFDPMTERRTFAIAVVPPDTASAVLASELAARIKQCSGPEVRVALRMVGVEAIVSEMERGEIDVLVSRQELVPMSLQSSPLVTEGFVMVQRRHHPRGMRPPSLAEFCELEHVVVPGPSGVPSFIDRALAAIGCARRIAIELTDPSLSLRIVAATDFVAAAPAHLVQDQLDRFAAFEIPFALPPVLLCASWHRRWQSDPGSLWLREQVARAAASRTTPTLAAA